MYELWDSTTLNLIDSYGSAEQGDAAIAAIVDESGMNSLSCLVLVHEDDFGESDTVAEGEAIMVAIKRLKTQEQTAISARRSG